MFHVIENAISTLFQRRESSVDPVYIFNLFSAISDVGST